VASKKSSPVPYNKPSRVSKAEMKERLDTATRNNANVPLYRFRDSVDNKTPRAAAKKRYPYVGVAGSRGVILPTENDPRATSLRNPEYGIEKKAKRVTKKAK
jgi:hypothetical protein